MSYQHVHEGPYPNYPPPGYGPPPPQPQGGYPPPGMPQPPGFYNGGYPPPPPPPGPHSYQGYFNDQYPPPPPPQHMYHDGGGGYGYYGDDNGCSSFLRGWILDRFMLDLNGSSVVEVLVRNLNRRKVFVQCRVRPREMRLPAVVGCDLDPKPKPQEPMRMAIVAVLENHL